MSDVLTHHAAEEFSKYMHDQGYGDYLSVSVPQEQPSGEVRVSLYLRTKSKTAIINIFRDADDFIQQNSFHDLGNPVAVRSMKAGDNILFYFRSRSIDENKSGSRPSSNTLAWAAAEGLEAEFEKLEQMLPPESVVTIFRPRYVESIDAVAVGATAATVDGQQVIADMVSSYAKDNGFLDAFHPVKMSIAGNAVRFSMKRVDETSIDFNKQVLDKAQAHVDAALGELEVHGWKFDAEIAFFEGPGRRVYITYNDSDQHPEAGQPKWFYSAVKNKLRDLGMLDDQAVVQAVITRRAGKDIHRYVPEQGMKQIVIDIIDHLSGYSLQEQTEESERDRLGDPLQWYAADEYYRYLDDLLMKGKIPGSRITLHGPEYDTFDNSVVVFASAARGAPQKAIDDLEEATRKFIADHGYLNSISPIKTELDSSFGMALSFQLRDINEMLSRLDEDALLAHIANEIDVGFAHAEETLYAEEGQLTPYTVLWRGSGNGISFKITSHGRSTLQMASDRFRDYLSEFLDGHMLKLKISGDNVESRGAGVRTTWTNEIILQLDLD